VSGGTLGRREWNLPLPFTRPLNMNDRHGNWQQAHRLKTAWFDAALVLARRERIPTLEHFTVVLHYAPRVKRVRDPENLTASVKPLVDGLVKAHVARGDDPRYYTPTTPVIHGATGEPGRLWLVVLDLAAVPENAPEGDPS
jgi:crossover junction endodeoxyribonuclease RusA